MGDYSEIGFNKRLEREVASSSSEGAEADVEITTPTFAGGQQGVATSLTGKYKINLPQDKITYNDGRRERLLLPAVDYIVSLDGSGDFGDIQEAIDYANTIGSGTILLKAGTYKPIAPIKMKNNVNLIGEGIRRTILDFGQVINFEDKAAVVVKGTSVTTTGSVTFTSGSSIVTGTSTAFSLAIPGDSIYLLGVPYEILSVQSNTQLTLLSNYLGGVGGTNLGFEITRPIKNCTIQGITIKGNSNSSGILLDGADTININSNELYKFDGSILYAGIKILSCYNSIISQNYIHDNRRGILFREIKYATGTPLGYTATILFSVKISQNEVFNNTKDGIRAELAQNIIITANTCKSNGGAGIFLRMCEDINVASNICNNNADGIKLWSYDGGSQMGIGHDCWNISVTGNTCSLNSGQGIHIRASASATADLDPQSYYPMYMTITGNIVNSNTNYGILLNGSTEFIGDSAETA